MTVRLMPQELARGIKWATHHHVDQLDKAGRPYILHPLWIMNKVKYLGDDYAILGVCHDVIEDKFATTDLGIQNFMDVVCNTDGELVEDLRRLTHEPEDSYATYIRKIKVSPRATAVKLFDLDHNSRLIRLKGLTAKDMDRVRKYHACHAFLSGKEDLLLDMV